MGDNGDKVRAHASPVTTSGSFSLEDIGFHDLLDAWDDVSAFVDAVAPEFAPRDGDSHPRLDPDPDPDPALALVSAPIPAPVPVPAPIPVPAPVPVPVPVSDHGVTASKGNSTRKRTSHELEQLRRQVQSLEQQLQAHHRRLTEATNHGATGTPSNSITTSATATAGSQHQLTALFAITAGSTVDHEPTSLWGRLAHRQRLQKLRALRRNGELRRMLGEQLQLANRMQRVLAKRRSSDTLQLESDEDRLKRLCRQDESTFERLVRRADASYFELDAVCHQSGFGPAGSSQRERSDARLRIESGASGSNHSHRSARPPHDDNPPPPASSSASAAGNPAGRLYLEVVSTKLVPFSVEATNTAVWGCLAQPQLPFLNGSYRAVSATEQVIHATSHVSLRIARADVCCSLALVAKRFIEPDRVVIVLEASSISFGASHVLHRLKLVERGWAVIQRAGAEPPTQGHRQGHLRGHASTRTTPLAQAQEQDASSSQTSVIQVCMRLMPVVSSGQSSRFAGSATTSDVASTTSPSASDCDDQELATTPHTGALTELMLSVFNDSLATVYQAIENMLLHQAITTGTTTVTTDAPV